MASNGDEFVEDTARPRKFRRVRGIPLRAVPANVITALALCSGLTGILFAIAASQSGAVTDWKYAVSAIVIAAVLDGMDGRIARMLHAESRLAPSLIRCLM